MSHYDTTPFLLQHLHNHPILAQEETAFCNGLRSAAPTGLNKCVTMINPGLAPWALQEYRPLGARCPTATINPPPQHHKQYNHNQIQKHKRNNLFTHPKTYKLIRQRALKGRHSCIAQGEMRAKPDMKPWGHTPNTTKSPERAALLQSPG